MPEIDPNKADNLWRVSQSKFLQLTLSCRRPSSSIGLAALNRNWGVCSLITAGYLKESVIVRNRRKKQRAIDGRAQHDTSRAVEGVVSEAGPQKLVNLSCWRARLAGHVDVAPERGGLPVPGPRLSLRPPGVLLPSSSPLFICDARNRVFFGRKAAMESQNNKKPTL